MCSINGPKGQLTPFSLHLPHLPPTADIRARVLSPQGPRVKDYGKNMIVNVAALFYPESMKLNWLGRIMNKDNKAIDVDLER